MIPPPPRPTLFPYTTLFRSDPCARVFRVPGHDDAPRAHADLDRRERRAQRDALAAAGDQRSEEHTSELQSHSDLVCRLLLEKKNRTKRLAVQRPAPVYPLEQ